MIKPLTFIKVPYYFEPPNSEIYRFISLSDFFEDLESAVLFQIGDILTKN